MSSKKLNIINYNNNIESSRYFQLKFNQDNGGLAIKKGGNVGINTTNPQNTLDVNGTASADLFLCEEVMVKLKANWPDYVFAPEYKLTTLEKEAQHIQEKGHLSGFPSAKEMGSDMELGNITLKQQVKIEEMMLHLIEMNTSFQNKIADLEAEIKALKGE